MPRWPAGLHRAGGSGVAFGGQPIRPSADQQETYWRRMATELAASAQAQFPKFIPLGPQFTVSASVGPTAAGETWAVRFAQVQTDLGVGQSPLLAQQVAAQVAGTITTPPPPIPAQAWLSAGGVNLHLLAQTTQGGYDNLDLGGQVVRTGEAVTVVWFLTGQQLGAVTRGAWFVLKGTRHTLSPQ